MSSAIAIGAIFLLQASWFVAWLTLDQRRVDARRDGFLPCCIKHAKADPKQEDTKNWGSAAMGRAADLYRRSGAVRAAIVAVTLALFGVGVWGTYLMQVEFDPIKLLPSDSYLRRFYDLKDLHYPTDGWTARLLMGELPSDDAEQIERLNFLVEGLEQMADEGVHLVGECD